MQLLKLGCDAQRDLQRPGEFYTLGVFHDRLLGTGAPIPAARKIVVPGDAGRSLE